MSKEMSTFEIKNRFTGAVVFSCDLSTDVTEKAHGVQLGFAVRKAVAADANLTRANLARADLAGANLDGANLTGANLTGANLTGANLYGADLAGADLDFFRQDVIAEILRLAAEMDALRAAIVGGQIDGSSYSGECSCLAGTLARAHGIDAYDGGEIETCAGIFRASPSSPRERWFAMIKPGDTPETNQASRLALEWVDEAIAIRDAIRRMN